MKYSKNKEIIKVRKDKKVFSNFSIFLCSLFSVLCSLGFAQEIPPDSVTVIISDSIAIPIQEEQELIADTILNNLDTMYLPVTNDILSDSTKRRYYWHITERTGEIVAGNPDTLLTDFPNRQLVEGQGIAMQYLGNLGSPAQSRLYFEQPERTDFMFMDNLSIYTKRPETFNFINTKIPYSNLSYIRAGSRQVMEERLTGEIAVNVGKKLNIGFDVDYLYARGFYNSQSVKKLDWIFFGSYISDRHRLHAFVNPVDYTNTENGGIEDDQWITNPQYFNGNRTVQTLQIPTVMQNTWNHIKGTRYYLNYRYNLGFERETDKLDSLGNKMKQFIPVSSIIYTFDYDDKFRRFSSNDSINLDNLYSSREPFYYMHKPLKDSTSYRRFRNTLGISLREGFNKWAKFDLTAFITHDEIHHTLMDTTNVNNKHPQRSTHIGGEIVKQKGDILRYYAYGEFSAFGKKLGDFNVSGNIETRIPILGDTASIIGSAYIKNQNPTFYENTFRSKYFVWDNDFKKTQKIYFGGTLNIPHTKTNLNVGVENITNYIYFNKESVPEQYSGNIQILAATLEQNLRLGILNWNNRLAYQQSGDEERLPLPDLSLYSNLFIEFKIAKVLTMQIGGNVHFFTKYYAPTYEPVTQQFRLQDEIKIGNYPLVNAFVNCHLKYTRFFVEFYNLSAYFIQSPAYFSTPHYPVNPMVFKLGLSWDFDY